MLQLFDGGSDADNLYVAVVWCWFTRSFHLCHKSLLPCISVYCVSFQFHVYFLIPLTKSLGLFYVAFSVNMTAVGAWIPKEHAIFQVQWIMHECQFSHAIRNRERMYCLLFISFFISVVMDLSDLCKFCTVVCVFGGNIFRGLQIWGQKGVEVNNFWPLRHPFFPFDCDYLENGKWHITRYINPCTLLFTLTLRNCS